MQDSSRGSAAGRERASVEGSNVSAKRQSRQRWSDEEKARVVRKSLRPGKRVGEVARRYGTLRISVASVASSPIRHVPAFAPAATNIHSTSPVSRRRSAISPGVRWPRSTVG